MARRESKTRSSRGQLHFRDRVQWIAGYPDYAQKPATHGRASALTFHSVPPRGAPTTRAVLPEEVGTTLRAYREIVRDEDAKIEVVTRRPERIEPVIAALGIAVRQGSTAPPWALFSARTIEVAKEVENEVSAEIRDALAWTFASEGLEREALTWALGERTTIAELRETMRSIDENESRVTSTVIRLARVAVSGTANRAREFLKLLATPGHHAVKCTNETDEEADGPVGESLFRLIDALLERDTADRRRALNLAVATYPLRWIEAWRLHHESVVAMALRNANIDLALRYKRIPTINPKAPTGAKLPNAPMRFVGSAWLAGVLEESVHHDERASVLDKVVAVLPTESESPGTRARLFLTFSRKLREDGCPPRFVELLRALARMLPRSANPSTLLAPWAQQLQSNVGAHRPRTWFTGLAGAPNISQASYLATLAALYEAADGPESFDTTSEALDTFAANGYSLAQSRAFAERVAAVTKSTDYRYVADSRLLAAAALSAGDPNTFAKLFEPLAQRGAPYFEAPPLLELIAAADVGDLVRAELLEGRADVIDRWGPALDHLDANRKRIAYAGARQKTKSTGANAMWTKSYPKCLWAPLRSLADAAEDAPTRADRVLGQTVRSSSSIRAEIETLATKLDASPNDVRLARRLHNLRERLETTPTLTPNAERRAKREIEREIRRAKIARVDTILDAIIAHDLEKHFGSLAGPLARAEFPVPASAAVRAKSRELVTGISRLPSAERRLGSQILERRMGEPPFDIYNHPENVRFLASMRTFGIDTQAWLSPNEERVVIKGDRERTLTLSLESDPLEVLMMGEHFGTCLSIDGENFFSTVVNAVDANKRVLYARERGKVIGRCLLALTDEAALLTFHPYCHDGAITFDRMVGAYAVALAKRIHARMASDGRVRPIVAPRWYDDGPRDLAQSIDAFSEGSDLLNELETIDPGALVSRLEAALHPEPLDARTLTLVLSLPVMEKRPELSAELARRAYRTPFVPFEVLVKVGYRCKRAGASELARELLRVPGLWEWIVRRCPCGCEVRQNVDRALPLLAQIAPELALRILRETRPRGVRNWRNESELRAKAAANAYRALGRPRQADRVLEDNGRV